MTHTVQTKKKGDKDNDLRFRALLSSKDRSQLSYRLRQAVRLIHSKGISIDFSVLLSHLYSWHADDSWVQRKWAEGYYQSIPEAETPEIPEEGGESDEETSNE